MLAACCWQMSGAQSYTTRVVKDNLFIPWEIIYGPDDHIWMTQKNGYICRLDPVTGKLDTLYHETNTVIKNEGGMLGMALHPNFSSSPYVYVAYEYNGTGGAYTERIVRYTYTGTVLTTPTILLDGIAGSTIHNGSRLLIADNKLYITTGDAGVTANAQNIGNINGKVLRINLDGTIPTDNPIPGSPVWNWGQRNIQGLTSVAGKLYTSMHGASTDDEINILEKGRNYGWPNVEGICNTASEMTFCADSNVVEPIYTWTPTIAPAGIDFYNHPMFPELQGTVIMTSLKAQQLYRLYLNAGYDGIDSVRAFTSINEGRLRDVCISPSGSIFISTSNSDASGTGPFRDEIIEIYDPAFTSVSEVYNTGSMIVYPNPVKDKVSVWMSGMTGTQWEYSVCDFTGRSLLSGRALLPFNVDVSTLTPGMYVLLCNNNNGESFSHKVIKQ
jgi:glucose/arabinose dehydrogenase